MIDPNVLAQSWYRLPDPASSPTQGDQLWGLTIPIASVTNNGNTVVRGLQTDIVVLTQACDLEHGKVTTVLTAPLHAIDSWIEENPEDLPRLEDIREGYDVSLYLLPAWPSAPFDEARQDRVVDFGELRTIERELLNPACIGGLPRLRLGSPAREHFAQAVARSFMRVGLPQDIPSFRLERTGREEALLSPARANPVLEPSGLHLVRDLPVSVHKRRRTGLPESFILLATRGSEPAINGAGRALAQAERSLAKQLVWRWQSLGSGDERFAWLTKFLRPIE